MVSLSECKAIRMVRHLATETGRKVYVNEIDLGKCSLRSAEVSGRTPEQAWSAEQYAAKLHTFNSEISEGFFSRAVVLVEGAGDKAVIEAWLILSGHDPYSDGIVVSEVSGKNNLDKPIIIFASLGIPCFWIFDNDEDEGAAKSGSIKSNRILQRLSGMPAEEGVDWPEGVHDRFAAWNGTLEEYVRSKVGNEAFLATRHELASEYHIDPDCCLKFPASAASMLTKFREQGVAFPELDEIVQKIVKLIE
jgi:hypothetical protein